MKKTFLISIAALVGAYVCFWVAAQIHNHFNPPVAVDGAIAAHNFMHNKIDSKKTEFCSEMQELYDTKSFKNIRIGSYPLNANKTFFSDIDNDGVEEELKYFHTRTYALCRRS